jgi:hypothetical protein
VILVLVQAPPDLSWGRMMINTGQIQSAGGSEAPTVLPEANLRFEGGGRALSVPQATRMSSDLTKNCMGD